MLYWTEKFGIPSYFYCLYTESKQYRGCFWNTEKNIVPSTYTERARFDILNTCETFVGLLIAYWIKIINQSIIFRFWLEDRIWFGFCAVGKPTVRLFSKGYVQLGSGARGLRSGEGGGANYSIQNLGTVARKSSSLNIFLLEYSELRKME
jgi:hypothetical protein